MVQMFAYAGAHQHRDVIAALRELQEYRTAAAQPIYQLVNDDWYDTEKEIYEEVVKSGGRGRIVFAAPQALNDAERQELRKLRNENALRRQQ